MELSPKVMKIHKNNSVCEGGEGGGGKVAFLLCTCRHVLDFSHEKNVNLCRNRPSPVVLRHTRAFGNVELDSELVFECSQARSQRFEFISIFNLNFITDSKLLQEVGEGAKQGV